MKNNINIQIKKTNRKTIALEITKELNVIVRAPLKMLNNDIYKFIDKNSLWIEKHIKLMEEKLELRHQQLNDAKKLTTTEVNELLEQAFKIIPDRVSYYSSIMGLSVKKISIKRMISRWGSCSSKANLNFNLLLMLMPSEVINYVVVHELCHLKEMNHSGKFWNEVYHVLPNYKDQRKWLKDNGNAIIQRII